MKSLITAALLASLACATGVQATNLSFTGNFNYDNDVQRFTFTLANDATVTLRTWSYAGGVNAQGDTIARGGFDPILTLFDASGIRIDQQDDGGCSLVDPDTMSGACYDINYTNILSAGTYTATIQQWDNYASWTLDAGFTYDGADYHNFRDGFVDSRNDKRDGHWALDLLNVDSASADAPSTNVPEPASLALLGIGAVGLLRRKRA